MAFFFYILLAVFSIYVGKYEKQMNVGLIAGTGAYISIPFCVMTGIACILIYKTLFFVLAILFMLTSKVKIFIKLKIGAILGSIAATMFAALSGPIGWVIYSLLLLFILSGIQEAFISIYETFFRLMAQVLMWIRNKFDELRRSLPLFLHPIICVVEATIVCYFALTGLWELMGWLDDKFVVTQTAITFKLLVLLPYTLILYRNYIKDTTPPNEGGEGIDSPLLLEFTNIVDAIF